MNERRKKVVIVGGGITGLTAAFYMQKEAKEKGFSLDVQLIEASNRLGGKIETVKRDGFVVERGPDSFLIRKKSMGILAEDVGLKDDLVRNATGQAYIFVDDKLHPIPGGSIMGIPTEVSPFLKSDLFSLRGKLRAAGDLFLPKSNEEGDQSLGNFFRRRLGHEVVDKLIEPLLSGVYSGHIDKMSLQATYPQFYEVEQKHRSLILGMKKSRPKQQNKMPMKREGAFHTLRNGLETLVEAISEQLEEGTVTKNVQVDAIQHASDEKTVLQLSNGQSIEADAIILTTGHVAAGRIFESHGILQDVRRIPTTSVATVALAFPKEAVVQEKEGTGFLISRSSGYSITACTWVDKKWPTTTPEDKVLLRTFVGKAGEGEIVDLSDKEIEQIALSDLRKMIDIKSDPEFTIVTRFKNDRPQYRVGHKKLIEVAKTELAREFPNVKLAGASYAGVGLPDCVDQGKAAVVEVLEELF